MCHLKGILAGNSRAHLFASSGSLECRSCSLHSSWWLSTFLWWKWTCPFCSNSKGILLFWRSSVGHDFWQVESFSKLKAHFQILWSSFTPLCAKCFSCHYPILMIFWMVQNTHARSDFINHKSSPGNGVGRDWSLETLSRFWLADPFISCSEVVIAI